MDRGTPLPIRIVVTDDLERSRVTVFFRLLLAIPHLIVVLLWGIAAFAVTVILWIALVVRGEGAAHAAGVRRVVPPLRDPGERVPLPRRRAVSRASAAPPGTRSTSRSTSLRGSRADGSPPGSCSRSRRFLLIAVLGGGMSGGSSRTSRRRTSGGGRLVAERLERRRGLDDRRRFSRGSPSSRAAGCRSVCGICSRTASATPHTRRATCSCSPTATRRRTRPASFPSSSSRRTPCGSSSPTRFAGHG